jgi:UDP-N-acetylglucosamine diphosphorylase/glucosamine-1-phosphate N-acetyltransferase
MNIQLNDNGLHLKFAPLTLTRPVGNLRMGLFTNDERWNFFLSEAEITYKTEAYLSEKFPCSTKDVVEVNAAVIPNEDLIAAIYHLSDNETLILDDVWLARIGLGENKVTFKGQEPVIISERWHLYQKNDEVLRNDFISITSGRISQELSSSNLVIGDESLIFLEEGAVVEGAILNTKTGPIYVGKEAEIMEGSVVRGPLGMNEHSALKLGTKVYGAVTLGPHCKVGGEVNNVVFQAYSNKGHDGFLGNALIGEWCNLGADTNTSNLKNNYGNVSTYSYETKEEIKTDTQFMGVCMGDHSKCGINTMFNTATVIGVSSNIFGSGFPQKFINSFTWGGVDTSEVFKFEKAIEYSNNMMARRGKSLTSQEIIILKNIFDISLK